MNRIHSLINILVAVTMIFPWPVLAPPGHIASAAAQAEPSTGIFRARITLPNAASRARLEEIGVTVLTEFPDGALTLATGDQLETLARLGFRPRAVDDLGVLVNANAPARPWLAESLAPTLRRASSLWERYESERMRSTAGDSATLSTEALEALSDLHELVEILSVEQLAAIEDSISPDSDGDGLTDTEESWWCTDPNDPNSDGDAAGYTDYEEINGVLDFTLPRSARWDDYGLPFGPPNPWPDFNGEDGNPDTPACNDGDHDTIPDYAEAYIVGTKVPSESTDGDKFDDGQELFGITYCPGGDLSCNYGSYPRSEYVNFIQDEMPNWVEPPGDNPFVAAFPVPEVYVVPGSWTVERVTTITTQEGEMVENSHSYETSVMRGEGTSIADTVTWNEWEEVSRAIETPIDSINDNSVRVSLSGDPRIKLAEMRQTIGLGSIALGAVAWGGCILITGGICAAVGGAALGLATFGISEVMTGADTILEIKKDVVQPNVKYPNGGMSCSQQNGTQQAINCIITPNNRDRVFLAQEAEYQGISTSLDGINYTLGQQNQILSRGLYDISYQLSRPRLTETRTNGRSWGGAQTTTHEVYEEHTISEGEAFTSGQNWSTAWAVDSSHAADLTFDYYIANTGTEYAREISNLVFNIYLGDDPDPLISYPAWQQFSGGKIENVFPGDQHNFSSTPIPLTLEQMKRIDLGEKLTVVLEDFSYGADELFYENAVNGGVTVFIEDGVDDGDELVDSYVIPTWGTESIQDVLTRFFPAGVDENGDINSLWTPEFDGINPPVWNEHYLSDIAWWNIYLTQSGAGNTALHEIPAQAGGAILFRFNRDSDRDGYKDSVELRYGTDKDDPASHPQPEILAGYVASRVGDEVTVLLKVSNSGSFDAYGIDAVMYSPDETTTIGNNTVGGNGRVRPGQQIAVGSLILDPVLDDWDNSTADPYAGGNYTAAADQVFTFTVGTAGTVGAGSTSLNWAASGGGSGTLSFGDGYHAPLPVDVADGLQIGFDTGTFHIGDRFTVDALTPRDTFTYTVESEPYTEPVIVLSYSDPQGSHRFITPVKLNALTDDLFAHSGEMLEGVELDILTNGAVVSGTTNTTDFVFNSAHPESIQDAHLYLNFVSDGELMLELPFTLTLDSGPTVYTAGWNTADFSQPYDPEADNILIAFWTDSENNIIDSAARPLNTFQEDPRPSAVIDASNLTWDFGEARQGTLMQRKLALSNVGYMDLLTFMSEVDGINVDGPDSSHVPPADMGIYTMTINTEYLPTGPFSETIRIRTSDPENPFQIIRIQGTILPFTPDDTQFVTIRPLDWTVEISGTHAQGEWVTYTHTLGPDPQTLHPIRVYSQDYNTLHGVGKYALSFANGAISNYLFGTGEDGNLNATTNLTLNPIRGSASGSVGSNLITTSNMTGGIFQNGQLVLIHQTQGSNVGKWEIRKVQNFNDNQLTLTEPLSNTYTTDNQSRAQVIWIPQYQNVIVEAGVTVSPSPWNGYHGGILVFLANGAVTNYVSYLKTSFRRKAP